MSENSIIPFMAGSPGVSNVTYTILFASASDIVTTGEPAFDAYVLTVQPVTGVPAYTLI